MDFPLVQFQRFVFFKTCRGNNCSIFWLSNGATFVEVITSIEAVKSTSRHKLSWSKLFLVYVLVTTCYNYSWDDHNHFMEGYARICRNDNVKTFYLRVLPACARVFRFFRLQETCSVSNLRFRNFGSKWQWRRRKLRHSLFKALNLLLWRDNMYTTHLDRETDGQPHLHSCLYICLQTHMHTCAHDFIHNIA